MQSLFLSRGENYFYIVSIYRKVIKKWISDQMQAE